MFCALLIIGISIHLLPADSGVWLAWYILAIICVFDMAYSLAPFSLPFPTSPTPKTFKNLPSVLPKKQSALLKALCPELFVIKHTIATLTLSRAKVAIMDQVYASLHCLVL